MHCRVLVVRSLFGVLGLYAAALHAQITVSERDAKRAAISKPAPSISAIARQLKVSGRVELQVLIDLQGKVGGIKVLKGNPLLVEGVVLAVRNWKFTPFRSDEGSVTKAAANLTFEFKQ